MIEHIEKSIKDAIELKSKLDPFTLSIRGMSNRPVRHLLNNLCSYDGLRILEVGSYLGSTAGAMLNNNVVTCLTAISWWGMWGAEGVRDYKICCDNLNRANNKNNNLKIIDNNFYIVDLEKEVGSINFLFWDGPHGEKETADGISKCNSILDNYFTLVVDDFDDSLVRAGTFRAIYENKWNVQKEWILKGNGQNIEESTDGFWNGIGIFLINK